MSSWPRYCSIRMSTPLSFRPVDIARLSPHRFYQFNVYIENATFSVSCDAFANLKVTLSTPQLTELIRAIFGRKHSHGTSPWWPHTLRHTMTGSSPRTLVSFYRKTTSRRDSRSSYWGRSYWTGQILML